MPRDFFPHRDSELEVWVAVLSAAVSGDPAAYGVPADEAARLASSVGRFKAAYATAMKPSTRTSIAILEKDNARGDMIRQVRQVVRYVQAWPGTDDATRTTLGLPVRDAAGRGRDAALEAPAVWVDSVDGISVVATAIATGLARRGRPTAARGVAWFSAIGDTAPQTIDGWTFRHNTQGVSTRIDFPYDLPPGTSVWVIAAWLDSKSKLSDFSTPMQTHVMPARVAFAA